MLCTLFIFSYCQCLQPLFYCAWRATRWQSYVILLPVKRQACLTQHFLFPPGSGRVSCDAKSGVLQRALVCGGPCARYCVGQVAVLVSLSVSGC
ncbi:uncharacterized protein BO66DRAFT_86911 [Aspergillus aculeatinus CBS 121060]|uniref:Uncharacterized protein n=1 Tax=Aspergillus aculeatinus CBS 121060 TaxID=1448322 RepID=A0ACD1H9T6_9EURO|nr:hypothetical protein BO66DRAFT_86911 [Aspergillus aculeatinus CBS 121060]RAH70395.1 hypothetical protein BO66DRAFT_86911 [Aspergillus aculeatinus CBS 121060]